MASAQEAMELVCRILLNPGDQVWIEDHGWSGAKAAVTMAGARLVPVPVDDRGLDVASGVRRSPNARLAYVTPSHQYPTGATLDAARRRHLLEWAEAREAWILEDDYDSEFRCADRPLPALQCLGRTDRVIYVGTFTSRGSSWISRSDISRTGSRARSSPLDSGARRSSSRGA